MASWRLWIGSCVALALAAGPGVAAEAGERGFEPSLSACPAHAAVAARAAAKFTLSLASCAVAAVPDAAAKRRADAGAQQLYLYDAALPASETALLPAVPGAAPAAARIRSAMVLRPAPVQRALALAPTVDAAARVHDIDPLLLHAIARVESRHNTQAVSPAGALGVMQVMPATAGRFGATPAQMLYDVPTNIAVGAAYLKTLQGRFGNDLPLVLAAYNAGEQAVERNGRRIPPYAETQAYVRQVLAEYTLLRRAAARAALLTAAGGYE